MDLSQIDHASFFYSHSVPFARARRAVASRRVDIECARTFSDGAGAKRRTASGGGGLARRRAGATAGGGDRDGGLLGLCAHRVVRAGGSETTTGVTRNEVGVTSTGCFALFLFGVYDGTRAYNQSIAWDWCVE